MAAHFSKFTQDEQDPKAVERVFQKVSDLVARDEEIQYIAIQKRPAVTLLPDSIIVTSHRVFICSPANLGLSMNYQEYPWAVIREMGLKEEIFGAKVMIYLKNGNTELVEFIPKVQARKLYRAAKDSLEQHELSEKQPESAMESQASAPVAEASLRTEPTAGPIAETGAHEAKNQQEPAGPSILPEPGNSLPNMPDHTDESSLFRPRQGIFSGPSENKTDEHLQQGNSNSSTGLLSEEEVSRKLAQLKSLFERQLISREEYEAKKKEVLSRFV